VNLCKIIGHKWKPGFISGRIDLKRVKFIAVYCTRCRIGRDELTRTIENIDTVYATSEENYWYKDEWGKNITYFNKYNMLNEKYQ